MNPNRFETTKYEVRSLVVDLWLVSQNIETNQSIVGWQIKGNSTVGSWYTTKNIHLNIDGNQVYTIGTGSIQLDENTVVASGQTTVNHNADGSKTISVYLEGTIYNYGVYQTVSGSSVLTTIPRASNVTATNANIESASSININRNSSLFTHALYYKFAGQSTWNLIASGVATSYGWTVPASVYSLIPNAKTIVCEILCDTYNGSTYIGGKTTTMTASVDEVSNAPDVSAVINDVNSVTIGLTEDINKIVKFISNARTQITAIAKNSATITSYKVTCGDGKTASTQDSTISSVESASFTVEATDSRGIKKTVVYNKTLIVYTKLTLNPTFYRTQPTNNEIALTYMGNYFNDTFGNTANTLSLKYRYREVGGTWSSYINLTPTKSGNTYSNGANPTVLGTIFDYTKSYQFEIIANDQIYTGSEIISTPTVARGIPVYWWKKLGMYIEEILYVIKGLRISPTSDVTLSSTNHPFQIGNTNGINLAVDENEIMARNNGVKSDLYLNGEGGNVYIGGTGTSDLSVKGNINVNNNDITKLKRLLANYNDKTIIQDHNNGNITISASGGDLYIGYNDGSGSITNRVIVNQRMFDRNFDTPYMSARVLWTGSLTIPSRNSGSYATFYPNQIPTDFDLIVFFRNEKACIMNSQSSVSFQMDYESSYSTEGYNVMLATAINLNTWSPAIGRNVYTGITTGGGGRFDSNYTGVPLTKVVGIRFTK